MVFSTKNFEYFFVKGLDNQKKMCYNGYTNQKIIAFKVVNTRKETIWVV